MEFQMFIIRNLHLFYDGTIGCLLLLISLIFHLVNLRRCKKGLQPKRVCKTIETVCLLFGCMNLIPVLMMKLLNLVGD